MKSGIYFRQYTAALTLLVVLGLSSCGGGGNNDNQAGNNNTPAPSTSESSAPSPSASTETSTNTTTPKPAASGGKSSKPESTTTTASDNQGVAPTGTKCPDSDPVKGKDTKKRGKIYHLPKTPDYDKVKPDKCFPDAAAAKKAGYQALK